MVWAQPPCFWSRESLSASDLSKDSCRRGQPPSGHGERADVAGPKWAGQSVRTYWATALPADGCPGRAQLAHHHLRCVWDQGLNVCLSPSWEENSGSQTVLREAAEGPLIRMNVYVSMYACLSISQGKGTNCGYITCPGFGTRFCTMTQRWKRSRGGPPLGTWRAVATIVLVRMPQHSSKGATRSGLTTKRSSRLTLQVTASLPPPPFLLSSEI